MTKNTSILITKGSGLVVLFLGLFFMFSFLFHSPALVQIAPDYESLKYNTVLAFICSGLGLVGLSIEQKRLVLIMGISIGIIGGITLIEHLFQINLRIDQFFFTSELDVDDIYPGRMSPFTAMGFFIISITYISLSIFPKQSSASFNRAMVALILMSGIVPFLGYLTGVEKAYAIDSSTAMALQAAILFIIIGVGLQTYTWRDVDKKNSNTLALWLSILVVLVGLFYTIAVWRESQQREMQRLKEHLQEETSLIQQRIVDEMHFSIKSLRRMAQRWEIRGGTPELEWKIDARNFILDTTALRLIGWIDDTYQFKWSEPHIKNQAALIQHIYSDQINKKLLEPLRESIMISSPFNFTEGYRAILVLIPLYEQQKFKGFFVGVYDTKLLVTHAIPLHEANRISIELKDRNSLIYSSLEKFTDNLDINQMVFSLYNKHWTLSVSPKKAFYNEYITLFPIIELFGGILFSLLLGSTLYYAITATLRNKLLIKRSEALRKSERRQQIVEEVNNYAIFWLDLQGNVETWNIGAERLFGYTAEEIVNRNSSVFFNKEDKRNNLPQKIIDKATHKGKFEGESQYIRKDTSTFWGHLTFEVIKNTRGALIGFAMIVQDITPRRLLETERSKLISIIEESPDFIGTADLKGKLLYHNRSAKKLVGLDENADLLSMMIAHMYPAWAFEIVRNKALPQVMETGSWAGETAVLNQITGEEIPVSQSIFLQTDPLGNPLCFTTIIRDITERKKTEETQESLIAQLSNSNMELERFAYVASHDMQEPLRMVVCFSDILSKEYGPLLPVDAKEYLDIVADSAKRMQEMIKDLLEYSRVSNEVKFLKLVNGSEALACVLENIKIFLVETKAYVTYDPLPNFMGNSIQFMRLIQNLIINGIKYQPKDSVPHIHIGVQERALDWCFSVQDNGLGVPAEFEEQVFQPFRRLHTWNNIQGTGLGLSICKKIVEGHGGVIWVKPAPECGSIFYFTIPKTPSGSKHE